MMKNGCDTQTKDDNEDRAPTSSSETTMSQAEGSDDTESSDGADVIYEKVTAEVILALTNNQDDYPQDQDDHTTSNCNENEHGKSSSPDEKKRDQKMREKGPPLTTTKEQESFNDVQRGQATVAVGMLLAPMPPSSCFGEAEPEKSFTKAPLADAKEPPQDEKEKEQSDDEKLHQKQQFRLETAILTLVSMEEAAVAQSQLQAAVLGNKSIKTEASSSRPPVVEVGVPVNRPSANQGPPEQSNTSPGAMAVYPRGSSAALSGGDIESAITGGCTNSSSSTTTSLHFDSTGTVEDEDDPHHIVNATLVAEDRDNNGHGDLVVEAKPALQGFAAIVRNERFKYVAAFFGIILLVIVLPLALLVPEKVVEGDMVESSQICGQRLNYQADYRGTISVTDHGRTCQNWAEQEPHSHSYKPEDFPNADLVGNFCRSTGEFDEYRAWCYTTDPDVRWQYCDVPFCGEDDMEFNSVCGTEAIRQKDYRGSMFITATGKTCMPWDSHTPHTINYEETLNAGLVANFCRNPDGEPMAWCYTNEEETRWEFCDVKVCGAVSVAAKNNTCTGCTTDQCGSERKGQADYQGTLNTTISGHACMRWDSDKAVEGASMHTPGLYPNGEGLDENFCRNPTYRKSGEWSAWCWIDSKDKDWDFCDVPFCEDKFLPRRHCGTASESQADYRGDVAVTETGQECLDWSASSEAKKARYTPADSPWLGLQANYCRNPGSSQSRAWCYVNGGAVWEYCNVEDCQECGTASMNMSDYRGSKSVTKSGKTCKFWRDKALFHLFDNSTYYNGNQSAQLVDWGIEENYCRSVERDSVWCFTDDETGDWDFCDVETCEEGGLQPEMVDCGSISVHQTDYRGFTNVTVSGKACQAWNSQEPHEHKDTSVSRPNDGLDGNFCRNPGGAEPVAWCFTEDDNVRMEYCTVPRCEDILAHKHEEDCGTPDVQQKDYRGSINITISGLACQPWKSQDPHPHRFTTPYHISASGLEENYCRNPDGSDKAWCFTATANLTWEYCNVPNC